MSIPFVDLRSQYSALRPKIQERINAVLEHGQYIMGPEVFELEEKLVSYTGAKYCITVASGTEALLISLMALNIGVGDEVITTPFTFAATAEVIVLLGATPVFVDVDPATGNLNPQLIETAINKKTKAIIPVSIYGQPADMDDINEIAARHGNIPVIEDAAQSFGANYKEKKSCNLSTIGCTSFFPSKPLGCYGDGGAIFTSDESLAQICREIRVHGQSERYLHTRLGVGGRMDTIQCAIVLAKLDRFDWEIRQRLSIGSSYDQMCDRVNIPHIMQRSDRSSAYAQYTVLVDNRDLLRSFLEKEGVPTAIHYPIPLNEQPAYKDVSITHKGTPVARKMSRMVMSLPMSADLTASAQVSVIEGLKKSIELADVRVV